MGYAVNMKKVFVDWYIIYQPLQWAMAVFTFRVIVFFPASVIFSSDNLIPISFYILYIQ